MTSPPPLLLLLLLPLPWVALAVDLGAFHEAVPALVQNPELERARVTPPGPRAAPETVTAEVESLLEPPPDVGPAADAGAELEAGRVRPGGNKQGSRAPEDHVRSNREEDTDDRDGGHGEGAGDRHDEDKDGGEEGGSDGAGDGRKGGEDDLAWAGRRPLDGTDWPKWAGGDGPHGSMPPRYSGGGGFGDNLGDGEKLPDEERYQRQAPSSTHQGGPWVQQWLVRSAGAGAGGERKAAEAVGAARAAAAEAARRAAHRSSFRRGWRGSGSRDTAHDESWGRRREYSYGDGGAVGGGGSSADLVAGGGVLLWQPWGLWQPGMLYL
ncbi:golgin subfamily A member 6-like protein 2 isoform X2 [Schistocerca cancellata]|uniref:golgin subfamily A member 6-like protein 2 isoform X2 n=1 Tax=Schistocerca cancellata TaxID=274614 RepID=UPI002119876A|nr:golgin subfamily A member 6-like protein 2 isoform X2 [Schistocerca cancellata]